MAAGFGGSVSVEGWAPEWGDPPLDAGYERPTIEVKEFKLLGSKECDGCQSEMAIDDLVRGVRIGFMYSEVCAECFSTLKEAVWIL